MRFCCFDRDKKLPNDRNGNLACDMERKNSGFPQVLQWGAILRPSRRSSFINSRQISHGEATTEKNAAESEEKSRAQIEMLISKAGRRIVSAVKGLVKRVESSRGVENIKDFLLGGYHRLSKPSSFKFFSCMEHPKKGSSFRNCNRNFCNDSDGYYMWSTDQEEEDMKVSADCTPRKDVRSVALSGEMQGSFLKFGRNANTDDGRKKNQKSKQAVKEKEKEKCSVSSAKSRAEACRKMEQVLREIVLKGNSNVEDVVDIEEFLQCYSGLTCPFYIDMVNRFFLDISSEFLPD